MREKTCNENICNNTISFAGSRFLSRLPFKRIWVNHSFFSNKQFYKQILYKWKA